MEYSIFNSIILISDKHYMLYNSFSDKFIILTSKARNSLDNDNIEILKKKNPSLFSRLVESSMIVDSNKEESEKLQKLIFEKCNNKYSYHLHINPTVDCIFQCWYCYEQHMRGSKMDDRTISSIKKYVESIFQQYEDIEVLNLSFFGGEPLMYFFEISEKIITYTSFLCKKKNVDLRIHFTTNGFLINKKIAERLKEENVSFQITLDGAKNFHDKIRFTRSKTGSFDRIVNNIIYLVCNEHHVLLRINYTTENVKSIITIPGIFSQIPLEKRRNLSVDIQRVWQDFQNSEDEEQISATINDTINRFNQLGVSISTHKILNGVSDPCYGDKLNHILINYNGDVFNCTARDFTKENRLGFLLANGKIHWETKLEERLSIKFSNKNCQQCRIAPICGGGCVQKLSETKEKDACIYGYTDKDIDSIILDRFEFLFLNKI